MGSVLAQVLRAIALRVRREEESFRYVEHAIA
jgi:hypothetical protein